MGTEQKHVMISSINNQIRYYEDIIRNLRMDAAEYTRPNYKGEIPELTAIEQLEYDELMAKIDKYINLKAREENKLKALK